MLKSPFRSAKTRKAIGYLLFLVISAVLLSVSYFHLLDNYELEFLDLRFNLRPKQHVTDKIVFVDIGDDTIEKLGRFPFDRTYHALVVKALSEAGARAIIFDIFFSEPHDHDKDFSGAIKDAGGVYLPYVLEIDEKQKGKILRADGYLAKTLDEITAGSKGAGHINILPDSDGKFRRIPLSIAYKDGLSPYISFLVSCDYLGMEQKAVKILPGRFLMLPDGRKVPLDEHSNMVINFSGKWADTYKHYSYVDVLQSYLSGITGQKPILDLRVFKDKICVIGLTAAGTVDLHPNPFETLYPGVGIHAEVFNSFLNNAFILRVSRAVNLAILIFLIFLTALITFRTKPIRALTLLVGAMFMFGIAGILLFNIFGMWIDLFYPMVMMGLVYLAVTFFKYIGEWKKRLVLENELDIARKIQESFLPKTLPSTAGLEISAAMFTARKVGGDLYDFVEFSPEELGVMIGDVSGKGIPASLFMAMVTGKFKFFAIAKADPGDMLSNLNASLVKESASNLFVTVFYLIFDLKNKKVTYSNGGHLPVAHLREGKKVEFLDVDEGAPLGLLDGPYSTGEIEIQNQDIFVLYTDGITEAMDENRQMYEKERLAACIERHRDLSAKALLGAIEKDVRRFEPKADQHDDMTIIVVKVE
ncbi:MAG: CHASE2 domain-containing protein [Candidatus Omnitrophica bacterium]|nr:CHASE2 domain-containing protein [Candidatus Omnitrophota bacterium]